MDTSHDDTSHEPLPPFGETIDNFAESIESIEGLEFPRHRTASRLLKALGAFGREVFDFFYKGFNGSDGYSLQRSDLEPKDYIFNLIREQVGFDLDVILRGYTQRQIVQTLSPRRSNLQVANTLDIADALAFEILKPAIDIKVVQPATVFTYFQKSLRIRHIPYARVAMIGLPFSALYDSIDWLAVPHEVGHYIYRHSALDDDTNLVKSLRSQARDEWYEPWLEEIFADVFGCLIAGPHIAESFLRMSAGVRGDRFWCSDGHHPTPALRPFIYIDTLKLLGKQWDVNLTEVTSRLEERWDDRVQSVKLVELPGQALPENRDIARMRIYNMIEEVVMEKLQLLVAALKPGMYEDSLFRRAWGQVQSWDELFRDTPNGVAHTPLPWFESGFTTEEHAPPDLENGESPNTIRVDLSEAKEIPLGKTLTEFDKKIETIRSQLPEAEPVSVQKWREILTFGGWIEKGPGGRIGHG